MSRRRGARSLGAGAVLAAVVLALLPGTASAAVTCNKTGTLLDVDSTADFDLAEFSVSSGNIVLTNNATPVTCSGGTPTVSNIDEIEVDQPAGLAAQVRILLPQGGFGPGATPEPTGISEIEFDIDMNSSSSSNSDRVTIQTADLSAADENDEFRLGLLSAGVTGVNTNAPEAGGADADDVEIRRTDFVTVVPGQNETDANVIDGRGGPEFAGPLTMALFASGTAGPDFLAGGGGAIANAGAGLGTGLAAGDDTFVSGPGTDSVLGGADADTVDYSRATGGVTVSLLVTGSQATGGAGSDTLGSFENIVGGPFGDNLTAENSASVVDGGAGVDTLTLNAGDDTFNALDNGPDTVDCGPGGADTGVADAAGVDTLIGCENVNFPPETTVSDGPGEGGATGDATPAYALAANEAATFEYAVDGGSFASCPAQCELPALSEGSHKFAFRAIDSTSLVEQTPVTRSLAVDLTSPKTKLKKPKVKGSKVTLKFSSDEAGVTFECRLDKGKFKACKSPKTYKRLDEGKHKVQVRATDAAGNGETRPVKAGFRVR